MALGKAQPHAWAEEECYQLGAAKAKVGRDTATSRILI